MSDDSPDFKPARILTVIAQIVLVWQMLAAGSCALATFVSMSQRVLLPPGIFEVYDVLRQSLVFSGWAALIMTMIWIFRISQNTHEIANPEPTISPGWAVGWFFVPVANLVQPYVVLSELYNANRQPKDWDDLGRPIITGIWGILNIAGLLLTVAVRISKFDMGTPPAGLVASCLAVLTVQAAVMLVICTRIAGWQSKPRSLAGVESVF